MQYAPDCVVVSPEPVRERVKEELRSLLEQYDMQI
ncbi:hypothetical protein H6F63_15910 [Trichocoleus sp. FACHB-40]|nr:hypothetical protein [Trichocoleus sp. FACHB-40]